ncbi:MAG TPA: SAM-dependent methyltransferase [Elusimicrobiota bacterium]|nr:SAM-dependent methyltransferase [Elusimicrobiota bacterium]
MNSMTESPIEHVMDTAFMVAAYRARETGRADALFKDALAERLAGKEGARILARLPENMFLGGWTVVIRTRIIDRMIEDAIRAGADAVLNLGAGLDARPYRMALPPSLRWIEVDHERVIRLKEERLADEAPGCALRRVALDLADASARQALFADVAGKSRKTLVLTEGVVPYLSEAEVASLADDLSRHPAFDRWIVDYFSPESYRYRRRSGMSRVMKNAPFRFEPRDYFAFFAAHRWVPEDVGYLAEEGQALGRPFPMPFYLKLWLRLIKPLVPPARRRAMTRFAGFVLFSRESS